MPTVTRSRDARGSPPQDAATAQWDGSPSMGKAEAGGSSVNPLSNPRMPLAAASVPPQEEQALHRGSGAGQQQTKRRQQSTWDLGWGLVHNSSGGRASQLLLSTSFPPPSMREDDLIGIGLITALTLDP